MAVADDILPGGGALLNRLQDSSEPMESAR